MTSRTIRVATCPVTVSVVGSDEKPLPEGRPVIVITAFHLDGVYGLSLHLEFESTSASGNRIFVCPSAHCGVRSRIVQDGGRFSRKTLQGVYKTADGSGLVRTMIDRLIQNYRSMGNLEIALDSLRT